VDTIRATLGDEAFADAWAAGSRLSPEEAIDYATRGRGSRGRPAKGWTSLTRTELDIVRLAAEGLSNPEIGARLFMSRATVKAHLSHVYAKLNVANRTELAALAVTRTPGGEHGPSG
jgi:DNA-binding CsgD family transcriptional regulator